MKGPGQFLSYLNQRKPILTNGYFATQDLGQWDEKGHLHILGRKDEVFQCGGENILPTLIEREFTKIEGVSEAVVVPRSDSQYGAVPWAFIQSSPMRELSYYQNQLRKELPGLFLPRKVLPFPKESQGPLKTQRAFLKDYAQRWPSVQDE